MREDKALKSSPVFLWFGLDLRLHDNPALVAAIHTKRPLVLLYIHDSKNIKRKEGGASSWWLYNSLQELSTRIEEKGGKLHFFAGSAPKIFARLLTSYPDAELFYNQRAGYEDVEQEVGKLLPIHFFSGTTLFALGSIASSQKTAYKIFTPFYKKVLTREVATPIKEPVSLNQSLKKVEGSVSLASFCLLEGSWYRKWEGMWSPGEKGALAQLHHFAQDHALMYTRQRDIPSAQGTSLLSASLHFGEISAGQLFHKTSSCPAFQRQLVWREFAHHLLHAFPSFLEHSLKSSYDSLEWEKSAAFFHAWKKGKTGYPIVDAGMRQLWDTGWMHNRVRMIVGSFLTKDLHMHWKKGAAWFWDTLIDADLANNILGWQWISGAGTDPSPFRVFNPTLQGKRFDPEGEYVRRYVPELAHLPSRFIHEPHKAPAELLSKAGIILGKTYPYPIVEHEQERKKAILYYRKVKR